MKNRKLTAALLLLMAAATPGAQAETLRVGRDDCRSMALRHSEELKKADNAVRQAELDVKIARTSYLPKFDGSATGIYMTPDIDMMGSKLQVKGAYMAGIQLVQPIYAGGKITAGNKLARIGR
ncbi:MAG: TolC family protein, partial [Muribaculaceae bacterium]|nr:TolC family protein [Muribaculaceae bacterium]